MEVVGDWRNHDLISTIPPLIGFGPNLTMRTIEELIQGVRDEAVRAPFPVDLPIYEKWGKDPTVPILYAGSLEAPICVFGRDLGKDEVAAGQPLIGAGGRLVRSGFYEAEHGKVAPKGDRKLESVLSRVLLTNTVPYKPPGNKAYLPAVKERFRPFVAELLIEHWRGDRLITLGTEAFSWFAPYALDSTAFLAFSKHDDRFLKELVCRLTVGKKKEKTLRLQPLPHPSPLNRRWYAQFPALLARRLAQFREA